MRHRRTTGIERASAASARLLTLAMLSVFALSACTSGPADKGPAISPILVGNNVWMAPSPTAWEQTAKAGVTMMRIGGTAYDKQVPGANFLDGWVDEIQAMGAQPVLQVSQFAGPQAAADLVTHYNVDGDKPITYWSIGNEPDCGKTTDQTAINVAAYIKPIAAAMKAVDPTIKIYAPDACDMDTLMYGALFAGDDGPADISGLIPGTKTYYVDGVSWHRYVGYAPANIKTDGLTTAGVEDFRVRMEQARDLVDATNAARCRTGDDALQWGLTEFNSLGSAVCSFENGQMFASIYGDLMKYGATMGATWSIAESNGSCGGTDFGFLDMNMNPRPSYFHMQMVANYFSGTYLEGQSTVDTVRSYGAIDRDRRRVSVMLMNIGTTDAQTCTVNLRVAKTAGDGCVVDLNGTVGGSTSVDLPPQSTTVLVFDLKGKVTRTVTYAKDDAAPTVTDAE